MPNSNDLPQNNTRPVKCLVIFILFKFTVTYWQTNIDHQLYKIDHQLYKIDKKVEFLLFFSNTPDCLEIILVI